MVKVEIIYDEHARKWDTFVSGVQSATEAKEAFNAVIIILREIFPTMEHLADLITEGDGSYHITPAV